MKTMRKRLSVLMVCFFSVLAITACNKKPAETALAIPALQGQVTFVSGGVRMRMATGGTETALEIGSIVPEAALVMTDKDATCEIQFGSFGAVHLGEKTTLDVSSLVASANGTSSEVKLVSGSVVCKVKKLSGSDRFRVRTTDMVCGVRGTRFLVSTVDGGSSRIAVQEGSVTVLPSSLPSIVPASLALSAENSGETSASLLDAVIEKITASAPVITAGQEISVTAADLKEADTALLAIIAEAQAADVATAGAADSGAKAETSTEGASTAESAVSPVQVAIPDPLNIKIDSFTEFSLLMVSRAVPLTDGTSNDFEKAAHLEIRDLPQAESADQDGAKAEGDSAAQAATAIMVSIATEPKDATIVVDGSMEIVGSFSGLYREGDAIDLKIQKEGYAPVEEKIQVTGSAPIVRNITLEKGSSAEKAIVGFDWASLAKPSSSSKISSDKILFVEKGPAGAFYACDVKSRITACASNGKILWTAVSGNGSNANSMPVVDGRFVAFAGGKLLEVFDASNGKALWSKPLDTSSTGLYGRHPAISGDSLVISTSSGLSVFGAQDGSEISAVGFSEGSDMSPAFACGLLYIVSKSGNFQIVDIATGEITKSLPTGAVQPVAGVPAIKGDKAVFVDRKGLVTAVALDASAVLWQKKLDDATPVEVFSTPIVTDTGVYVTAKGKLYAFSLASGARLFAPTANVATQVCPVYSALVCGEKGNALLVLDAATGSTIKRVPLAAPVSGTPVLSGSTVIAPLADGQILFFDVAYK